MKKLLYTLFAVLLFISTRSFSQSVTVTAPNGGESWAGCSTHNITWTISGTSHYFNIDYSINGGLTWIFLATGYNQPGSTGSFAWTLPNLSTTQAKVRVYDQGTPAVIDESDNTFSINAPLIVTSPNGGESWQVGGSTRTITWTASGTSNYYDLDYSIDNGVTWNAITSNYYQSSTNAAYTWTLPNNPSTTALVRVKDHTTSCMSDVSDAIFTIAPPTPSITVTAPTTGATVYWSSPTSITWYSSYTSASFVKIEYSLNNGNSWTTVVNSTSMAAGSYSWTPPSSYTTQALVRISEIGGTSAVGTSGNFTIRQPYIVLSAPNGGNIFTGCGNTTISWTPFGTYGPYTIELSTDGGLTYSPVATAGSYSSSYSWNPINNVQTSQARIRVSASNAVSDTSATNFTINKNTDVIVNSPNGGEVWTVGTAQNIQWSFANMSNYYWNIEYSTDNGVTWNTVTSSYYAYSSPASYGWSVPNNPSMNTLVRVTNTSNTCKSDVSDAVFTIQPATPFISVSSPNAGSTVYWNNATTISWFYGYTTSNFVKIEYSVNQGSTWTTIVNSTNISTGSYTWPAASIPNVLTNQAWVRISEVGGTNAIDTSSYFTIRQPYIVLNSPNGGNSFVGCSSTNITWSAYGITSLYAIELSTNGGATFTPIAYPAAYTTSYSWNPINNVQTSQARIRIISSGAVPDTSNANFTINQNTDVILNSPNGGEVWQVGGPIRTINWSFVNMSNYYWNLEYSTDNGVTWNSITSSYYAYTSPASYSWSLPNNPSTTCLVRVTNTSNTCKFDESDAVFTIAPPTPYINVGTPGGTTVYWGNSATINWSNGYTSGNFVKIEYSTNLGSTWNTIVNSTNISTGSYTWPAASIPNISTNQAWIRVSEIGGTNVKDTSSFFIIRQPYIVLGSQNGGQSYVGCNATTINWTGYGITNAYTIYLSTNNGATYTPIAYPAAYSSSYSWNPINNVQSSQCKLMVSSSGAISDTSNAVFTINQNTDVIVNSPNGGETWVVGGAAQTIQWVFANMSNYYWNLEYSTDNGVTWNSITSSYYAYTSPASYSWSIPNNPSTTCLVRVINTSNTCKSDVSDAVFTIAPPTPYINVGTPGGSTVYWNNAATINWSYGYTTSNFVKIEYSVNQGSTWNTIVNSTNISTGAYSWPAASIPNITTNQAWIRVSEIGGTNAKDTSSFFTIRQPYIVLGSQNGGQSYVGCNATTINWTGYGITNSYAIYLSTNNGTTFSPIAYPAAYSSSYSWNPINNVQSGQCKLMISSSGALSDTSNAVFTINQNTDVVLNSPNGGEVWTVGGPNQTITWSFANMSNYYWNLEYSTDNGVSWNSITSSYYAYSSPASYSWSIPNNPSTTCLVRVTNTSNTCKSDVSDAVFTIAPPTPYINVGTPGGTTVYWNNAATINWSNGYTTSSFVKIEYSTNLGSTWNTIVNSTNISTGSYTWPAASIPNISTNQAWIRVSEIGGTNVKDTSSFFIIRQPYIVLGSQNGGQSYVGCNATTINWTGYGITNAYTIFLSTNNGATFTPIAYPAAYTTSYSWNPINNVQSGQCKLMISSSGAVSDTSNAVFTINQNTDVMLSSPNGGEVWAVGGPTQLISWSFANMSNYYWNVEYSIDNGATWISILNSYYVYSSPANYYWTVPNTPSSTCLVRVINTSNSCKMDVSDAVFTISPPVPFITVTSPNGGNTLYGNSSATINWNSGYLTSSFVKIEYSYDNGTTWNTVVNSINNTGYYNWPLVPATYSNQCLVRITDLGNAGNYDISDAVFTIAPPITVTAPNGGENLGGCTVTTVTWTAGGTSLYYDLYYSLNNGVSWNLITSNFYQSSINCSYNWTMPNTPSTLCLVRVLDHNATSKMDVSNAVFTIQPTITITNPNFGGAFQANNAMNITWNAQGASGYYNIDYSTNGGSTWTNIITNQLILSGTYSWTTPNLNLSNVLIRVMDYVSNCKQDISDVAFSISTSAAPITVSSPNGAEQWTVCDTTKAITWTSNGSTSGTFDIELSTNSGSTWSTIVNNYSSTNGYYKWTIPNLPSSTCLIRVKDHSNGSIVDASNAVFSIAALAQPGTITGATTVCQGTSQTYYCPLVSGATKYIWTLPSGWVGYSTNNSITVSVGAASGSIAVMAMNACDTSLAQLLAITVNQLPSIPGAVTGTSAICANSTQTYAASVSSGATSYTWTLPSGWTGTSSTTSISAISGSTSGNVSVIANNSCGSSAASVLPVSIITAPSTPGTISGLTSPCQSTLQTYSVASVPNATYYTWTSPSGWVGTSTTSTLSTTVGTSSGNLLISAGNACGSGTVSTLAIVVGNVPATPNTILGADTSCAGANIIYSVAPVSGATSYTWTLPSGWTGTSNSNSISVAVGTNGGTISVKAVNACGNSALSSKNVLVNPAPSVVSAISGNLTVCQGNTQSYSVSATPYASSYLWSLPNGWTGSSTTNSIAVVPGASGGIVSVVASNQCGATSPQTLTVTVNPLPASPGTITGNSIICPNANVIYSFAAVSGASSYTWSLPSGWTGTSTSNTINITANNNGGTVSVNSVNGCGASSPTLLGVTVSSSVPTPSGVIGQNNVCGGAVVNLHVLPVVGATSYSWTLPGSWSGASVSDSIQLTVGNTSDTVWVRALNACGVSVPLAFVINVNPATSPNIAITGTSTVCAGSIANFTSTVTNAGSNPSYSWNVNGSASGITGASFSTASLANGDVVTCTVTNNSGCSSPASVTSNALNVLVSASVTPSVAIAVNTNPICAGSSASFIASVQNGGTSPVYTWFVNGVSQLGNAAGFSSNALTNGDVVTCQLVSNGACLTASTVSSNAINLQVTAVSSPSISINTSGNTICPGATVSFVATSANAGTSPVIDWYVNGVLMASGNNLYSSSSLTNNDTVYASVTASGTCLSPTVVNSNQQVIAVVAGGGTPTATVTANNTAICSGATVNFNALVQNGGASPVYDWLLNGISTGVSTSSYSTNALINGDIITCAVSGTNSCGQSYTISSNAITISVNASASPSIVISGSASTICSGAMVTFTATTTNAGVNPSYQWLLNGIAIPAAFGTSYSSSALQNGDVISCQLTANGACATPSVISSNSLSMTVNAAVTSSVIITGTNTVVCGSGLSSFVATTVNEGALPSYQWFLNNNAIPGANSLTYIDTLNNNDLVSFVLTSNAACVSNVSANSNVISVTVNSIDTVSINITANNNSICAGMPVTFTVSALNGGVNPVYDWLVNGISSGVNAVNFVTSSLNNNDVVSCSVISSKACVLNASVSSNAITMAVINGAAPSITVTASSTTICSGSNISFTANIANGGATPTYQWNINALPVSGATAAVFSSNTLNNGDIVTCTLNAVGVCGANTVVISNPQTITVTASLTPSIAITASSSSICAGTSASFTATASNMGTSPTYQWSVNSIPVSSATSFQWSTASLSNNDTVTCLITANPSCAAVNTALSAPIIISVNALVTPSVSIVANDTSVCAGTSVVFTPTAINGGVSPTYTWYVNGINSATGATFTSAALQNNDVVTCSLNSSLACVSSNPVNSSAIVMQIGLPVNPVLSVNASSTTICSGTAVNFNATASNVGTNPSYQWYVNNNPIASATGASYVSTSLNNGDQVAVTVTSSVACTVPASITSSPIAITVNPSLVANVALAANPSNIVCSNVPLSFNATPLNGGSAPLFAWYINGTLVSNSTIPSFITSTIQNGDSVSVMMTSNLSCVTNSQANASPVIMTINAAPSVLSLTSNGPVCEGANLLLNATASDAAATFSWTGPNGFTSNLPSPILANVSSANAGIYTVTATANACTSIPFSSIMQVNTNPAKPFITQNGNVLSSSSPSGNQWYFAAAPINGATNNTYTAMQVGYYQVLVSNAAGCSSISDSFHMSKIIGVGLNQVSITAPRIYPNPFEDILMIEWPLEIRDRSSLKWQLININGQVVQQGIAEGNREVIGTPELSKGTYLLKVEYKELEWKYPVIKQ